MFIRKSKLEEIEKKIYNLNATASSQIIDISFLKRQIKELTCPHEEHEFKHDSSLTGIHMGIWTQTCKNCGKLFEIYNSQALQLCDEALYNKKRAEKMLKTSCQMLKGCKANKL